MHANKNLIKIIFILIISLLLLSPIVYTSFDSVYVWSDNIVTSSISTESNTIPLEDGNILNLESTSAILIEQNSGQVLYEHNSHEKLRPASVTKIMSILLIMEAIDGGRISYTDKVSCSETAAAMGGSQIWLDVREELTVDEMLKAICVVSANEYAHHYYTI